MRIGVISDTHGLLRPEAVAALRGSAHIVHAGDIGDPQILRQLEALAPLTAVKGNNDCAPWAEALPDTQTLSVGGIAIHVLHDLKELAIDPVATHLRVVIAGHSHKPAWHEREGVLYLNPGSAGPRRFRLPITLAQLDWQAGELAVRIVELFPPASR